MFVIQKLFFNFVSIEYNTLKHKKNDMIYGKN